MSDKYMQILGADPPMASVKSSGKANKSLLLSKRMIRSEG